jgi:solute:Na+ symporter, SSS family
MQRAFAARDLESAENTPIIAAFAKALFPIFTVIPGMAAVLLMPWQIQGNYNLTLPLMLLHFYPTGLLGLGITALMASFMAGMAGNVTAFNTVWTYDLYQTYLARDKSDRHYLIVGRLATVVGVIVSVAAAYMALQFDNIFEYWALLSSIFIGTGFATFFLGIFVPWVNERGAFWGMLAGYLTAIANYVLFRRGLIHYGSMMEMDFLGGTWGFVANALVTCVGSLNGVRKSEKELEGLVFRSRARREPSKSPWLFRPVTLAIGVAVLTVALNILFR